MLRPTLAFALLLLAVGAAAQAANGTATAPAGGDAPVNASRAVIIHTPGRGGFYAPNFYAAFHKAKLNRFRAMVDAAKLRRYFSNPTLKITAWPPEDAAFNEFLADIGCNFRQALRNSTLARLLVLYHTTPGARVTTKSWLPWPKHRFIPSGLGYHNLMIEMDDSPKAKDDSGDWRVYDIKGTDDDAELVHNAKNGLPDLARINLKVGVPRNGDAYGLMSVIDDVLTFTGLKDDWAKGCPGPRKPNNGDDDKGGKDKNCKYCNSGDGEDDIWFSPYRGWVQVPFGTPARK